MILLLAACSSPTATFALAPSLEAGPGLSAVQSVARAPLEFATDELVYVERHPGDVVDFLERTGGEVLQSTEGYGADLPTVYVVRIDPDRGDPATLPTSLRSLGEWSRGELAVSDAAGLGTIALAAGEAARGGLVGLNWTMTPATLLDGHSVEGTPGPNGYLRDAFTWPMMAANTVQDIGVTDAWRVLEASGGIDHRVTVAIIDQGFAPDEDTPEGWDAISQISGEAATGTEGHVSWARWHGQNVSAAAFAVPDNEFGAAGPAGPVAEPLLYHAYYSYAAGVVSVLDAYVEGADMMNMSWSGAVPAGLGFTVWPFDAVTASVGLAIPIFAAAGNEGADVDAEDCFWGACWEEAWHTPCENHGVTCVGGLAHDSIYRDSGSNYGDDVDLYAPFTMWVGPDPVNTGEGAHAVSGTSFSSPFAAGVAALVYAADPSLDRADLPGILIATGHTSPDNDIGRYVDASAAVRSVTPDQPPYIDIDRPETGGVYVAAYGLSVSAIAWDMEDGLPEVSWWSSVDGDLGIGQSRSVSLSEGVHLLVATATDSDGNSTADAVVVTMESAEPRLAIGSPAEGSTVAAGGTTVLHGSGWDPEDGFLPCAGLTWTSSDASDPLPVTGCDVPVVFGTEGPRTLTLTGSDSSGLSGLDTVSFVVGAATPGAPTVQVDSPVNGSSVSPYDVLDFSATVTDPDGETGLTYRWTVEMAFDPDTGIGEAPIAVTTALSFTASFDDILGPPTWCDTAEYVRVTLTATDPTALTGSDSVVLFLNMIC